MNDSREIEELLEINSQVTYLLQYASEKSNKLRTLFEPIFEQLTDIEDLKNRIR